MTAEPKLTFAKAYSELQEITREFEAGELDLEKSIPKFKRSAELVKFLKQELAKIENQIEEINVEFEPETKSAEPAPPADPEDQSEIPF
jgi:exodeoxyribonuclease VII small subunit